MCPNTSARWQELVAGSILLSPDTNCTTFVGFHATCYNRSQIPGKGNFRDITFFIRPRALVQRSFFVTRSGSVKDVYL